MLTRKQHQLLIFINERLNATGVAPSFDEMKEALGLKSKSGIHRLISGLEERGFIRRLAHRPVRWKFYVCRKTPVLAPRPPQLKNLTASTPT